MLVKGAAKPMKERLGGKPASATKTWAARGKKRLQDIRNLIGRGRRGGPGGGAGSAPGWSAKPQQRWAAARVPAGSRRAPAEAMRATLAYSLSSDNRCAFLAREEKRQEGAAGRVQGPRAQELPGAAAPLAPAPARAAG